MNSKITYIIITLAIASFLITSQLYTDNAFAARVKSRHLTPFQSGFIDGLNTGSSGSYNNLGAYHTKEYYRGYSEGYYEGCTYHNHKYVDQSDLIKCGNKPIPNFRLGSYLSGYVDEVEGITSVLINNVDNHSQSMKDYRSGYDDAQNPCYGKDCY